MAEVSREEAEVNARIVYWGVECSGKSANLHEIHVKLRSDHRGELKAIPTRFDPTVSYEVLPIELGDIGGMRTRIQIIAVPGQPEQAPTRKQLLDQVDGIVLVVDAQRDRIDENVQSLEELRKALADYGRELSDVPLVVQYNKRDLADPYALEEIHRRLGLDPVAAFEAVASEGTGVLQTLSTISKRVIRTLREQGVGAEARPPEPPPPAPETEAPAPDPAPVAEPEPALAWPAERMERALELESEHPEGGDIDAAAQRTETLLDAPWTQVSGEIARPLGARLGRDLSIVSVGEATRAGDRAVRVPLVLGDGDGQTSTLVLTIQLDPLPEEDGA